MDLREHNEQLVLEKARATRQVEGLMNVLAACLVAWDADPSVRVSPEQLEAVKGRHLEVRGEPDGGVTVTVS